MRLALLLALAATPAFGLSCQTPNFGETFNRIAAAPEIYSAVYGEFRQTGRIEPYEAGKPREVVFEFTGRRIALRGAMAEETLPVTVRTTCTSVWCGVLPPTGTPVMAFLRHDPQGMTLASDPCESDFWVRPSLGQTAAIRACMRLGRCGPEEISAFSLN